LIPLYKVEAKIKQIQEAQGQLGPLVPRYLRRKEDGNVPGAFGINDDDDNANDVILTDYAKSVNDKKTAVDLVEVCLEDCLHLLNDSGLKFNKKLSSLAKSDKKYYEYQQAVYRYLAFYLITNGSLCQAGPDANDCGGPYIALNKDGAVKLYSSKPEKVQTKEIDPITKEETIKTKVVLTKTNDFTPKIGELTPQGIDPLSAKWILAQLTEQERDFLKLFLLQPLVHTEAINGAQEYFNGHPDRVKLIDPAYLLIKEIGFALEEKFHSILFPKWKAFIKS